MKGKFVAVLSVIFLVASTVSAEQVDPVAKVNGNPVSKADFDRNWTAYTRQRNMPPSHAEGSSDQIKTLKMDLLNILIGQELLWQEAKKKNYTPDEKAVGEEITRIRGQFPSEEVFNKVLADNGLAADSLKEFITRKLSVDKLVQTDVAKNITVGDKEIHDYYAANLDKFKTPEQVRARHILIQVDPKADQATKDTAKKKIDGILKEVKSGADFAEVAKKNSECPSSKNGGDLGLFAQGQMVKPFEEVAFALKPGETSDVVETQFGYHIIKVEEHKQAATLTEENVSGRIKEYLTGGKINQAVQDYMKELRKNAKVEFLTKFE